MSIFPQQLRGGAQPLHDLPEPVRGRWRAGAMLKLSLFVFVLLICPYLIGLFSVFRITQKSNR